MARQISYGGTLFFVLLLAVLIFDTERRVPAHPAHRAITSSSSARQPVSRPMPERPQQTPAIYIGVGTLPIVSARLQAHRMAGGEAQRLRVVRACPSGAPKGARSRRKAQS